MRRVVTRAVAILLFLSLLVPLLDRLIDQTLPDGLVPRVVLDSDFTTVSDI